MTDETAATTDPGPPVPATAVYRSVLVPLDGSDEAERALGPGAWLAARLDADLHVVAADVRDDERFWYEPYLDSIVARLPGTTAHCTGEPEVVTAIRRLARELAPCLACVATHGRSRSAALLGSTFTALASTSEEPLVAIGPEAVPHTAPDPRRIVACVDGSLPSQRAVSRAASWARALTCRLSLITVAEPDGDDDADEHLRRLTATAELGDLAVEALVLRSSASPHAALMRHIEQQPATVIVVASHARTGLSRAVIGSEAARIVHDSPIPVLVQPALVHDGELVPDR